MESSKNRHPRNVVVFGRGSLARKIAETFAESDDWSLIGVVTSDPEPAWMESLSRTAKDRGWEIISRSDLPQVARETSLYLGFSCYYDQILTSTELSFFQKCLNLHNSPLPRYRGVNPINWALKNGETHHGVTIHEISPGVDDGPIITQALFSVSPEVDEVIDIYKRCVRYGELLFRGVFPDLHLVTGYEQDHGLASHYRKSDSKNLGERFDFHRDIDRIDISKLNF